MIVKNPDQRIAILVDVQNLYYSAKNLYSARVNYKNLLKQLLQGRILTRAIAYVINADESRENDFFEALNNAGFEIKIKKLQVFYGGAKKGDWDLGIAMDAIRLGQKVSSNPPINSYLTDDDLRIFVDISKKRFLSYPWKSLVLAVATDNIPLQTKDSTISVRELSYIDFQNANCDEKKNLAVKHRIDYVYGQKIDCKGFTLVSNSSEGLLLYKYIN